MKSIKKMVYSNQIFENDIEKLEIIGFDRLWNLTKIVINLVKLIKYYLRATKQILECTPVINLHFNLYNFFHTINIMIQSVLKII